MTEHTINLHARLWDIANTLRGKMGADDFRDYILGFIFYKYLSDKMDSYGAEEELDKQQFSALMETYVYSSQEPIREDIFACLGNRPSVLKAREIGERILGRMKEFVAVFVDGMAA